MDHIEETLPIGDALHLQATVLPADATNQKVQWTSSTAAATVDADGIVTARKAGTAVITAMTRDGGFQASCAVKVLFRDVMGSPNKNDPDYQYFYTPAC